MRPGKVGRIVNLPVRRDDQVAVARKLDTRINWFSNIALRGVTPVSALCRA
ncbi:MAG: hypothetical protein IH582_14810 [Afipia sp.]|nr:hypothetical protein [Afipia sp.]